MTWVDVFDWKRRSNHGGKETMPAHFEINITRGLSFTAPLRVRWHDALVDEGANAMAVGAVRFLVVRAVEARVPAAASGRRVTVGAPHEKTRAHLPHWVCVWNAVSESAGQLGLRGGVALQRPNAKLVAVFDED